MPRKPLPRITDGELEILQVLWKLGGRTVREITDALAAAHPSDAPGTTAVATRLKIMVDKGLVREDLTRSPKLFLAAVAEQKTKRGLLKEFMGRVFGGSREDLMMHALGKGNATAEELDELTRRLDNLRKRK